ncbi:hypothetical protein D3C72_1234470 [compost metagenome]
MNGQASIAQLQAGNQAMVIRAHHQAMLPQQTNGTGTKQEIQGISQGDRHRIHIGFGVGQQRRLASQQRVQELVRYVRILAKQARTERIRNEECPESKQQHARQRFAMFVSQHASQDALAAGKDQEDRIQAPNPSHDGTLDGNRRHHIFGERQVARRQEDGQGIVQQNQVRNILHHPQFTVPSPVRAQCGTRHDSDCCNQNYQADDKFNHINLIILNIYCEDKHRPVPAPAD